jgi:hypothetical protein
MGLQMLHAYDDLALNPVTYDTVSFLMHVEFERIARGEDEVEIEFVPGPNEGYAHNRLWPETTAERQALFDAVALPMMRMLPTVNHIQKTLVGPLTGSIGWGRYTCDFQNFLTAYREGIRPLRPSRDAAFGDHITFTLRESVHWPPRNSHVTEWVKAAYALRKQGRRVIIVRDTCKADEEMGALETAPRASRDLEARAILYRSAAVNVFVSNGPSWFCLALDAPTIILRPATDGAGRLSSVRYVAERYRLSCGLPNAPAHQCLLWQDDDCASIVGAVTSFLEKRQAA